MKNRMKHSKKIVAAVLLLAAVVYGLFSVRFQTPAEYKEEQLQLAAELFEEEDSATGSGVTADSASDGGASDGNAADSGAADKKSEPSAHSAVNTVTSGKKSKKKTEAPKKGVRPLHKKTKTSTKRQDKTKGTPVYSAASKNEPETAVSAIGTVSGEKKNGNSTQTAVSPTPAGAVETGQKETAENESEKQTDKSEEKTEPVKTAEPEKRQITCTVEICCDTLLSKRGELPEVMCRYIPADGVVLSPVKVKLDQGTNAYEALRQVCKAKDIALEAEYSAIYKSSYVRGIAHLYEKQAGDMSGWLYCVNNVKPNVGASRYVLEEGDTLTWCYTCDGRTR